jgi:hypothetical protein
MLARTFRRGLNMPKFKYLPLLGALAVAAFVGTGSGSARAGEISFGNPTQPSPNSCVNAAAGQEGQLCGQNLTFDGTYVANGYKGNEFTGNGTLAYTTLKSAPQNSADESGLGENDNSPVMGSTCTDNPDCEIAAGRSVEVSSNGPLLTDVVIGSVQSSSSDVFDLYGFSNGSWSSIALNQTQNGSAGGCSTTFDGLSDTCYYNNLSGYSAVGVYDVTGNVLLTAVSPAPPIGKGLPVILAVGGLLFGVKLWERSKKRRLLGAAAIAHAAA